MMILTIGSRGDVQPYVALGQGLQAAGHDVTICTGALFQDLVTAHHLPFLPMVDEMIRLTGRERDGTLSAGFSGGWRGKYGRC
jgi:sterol 3beta-glucosyltransferase